VSFSADGIGTRSEMSALETPLIGGWAWSTNNH